MIDSGFACASDAKRNLSHNVVHDLFDRRTDLRKIYIRPDRQVPAGDVKTNAAERNLILICDNAANRLGIAFVPVSTQHSALSASRDARFNLLDCRFVVLPENLGFRRIRFFHHR